MPADTLELVYVYSHADEALHKLLEKHLSLLNRQSYIYINGMIAKFFLVTYGNKTLMHT
jgi:hypothetical protein